MARLGEDFDAPRLHRLGHFAHEVDFEQAMLECCTVPAEYYIRQYS
jgi:hypothetical protein